MIRSLIILLIILSVNGLAVSGQHLLSIDSCQALARRNYPMIRRYELIEKSKEYTLSNASKAYLPQVSLTGIGGYILGGMPGGDAGNDVTFIGLAQVNQTIWDGGATKAQKEIAEASAETEKATLEVTLYDLRSRINQLYLGILMTDEQLAQISHHETVLNNNVERITQMNENGTVFETDLQEIQVEQLKLSQQRKEINFVRHGFVRMLSLFTGVEINDGILLVKPQIEGLLTETGIVRPELFLYESQRNLINAQGDMQRVSLMPKVGLMGIGVMIQPGLSLGPTSLSTLGVVGISASWNLNGFYKNSNEKKLNQLSLDKINLQQETFLFNTKLQTTQVSASIDKQRAILAEDGQIVNLRMDISEGYQLRYENGMCSLLDLLDATQKESEAQTQRALHEIQLLIDLYDYKTMTGNEKNQDK